MFEYVDAYFDTCLNMWMPILIRFEYVDAYFDKIHWGEKGCFYFFYFLIFLLPIIFEFIRHDYLFLQSINLPRFTKEDTCNKF